MSVFQFHGTVPPTLGFGEGLCYTSTKITPFGSQIDLKLFIWMHKIITLGHKYFKDLKDFLSEFWEIKRVFKKSTHFCFAPFWASWRPRNKIKDISVVPCLSSFRKYPCFSILINNEGGYGQKHVCYTIFSIRNSIWSFLFDFHGFSLPLDARNLLLYGLFIWYLTFFTWSSFQKLGT